MLSLIRRHLAKNVTFTCAILIAFTVMACDDGIVTPKDVESQLGGKGQNLTGQDYYLGIFMGQGVVADAIPEIRDNYAVAQQNFTSEELATIDAERGKLLALVDAYDPGFFDRLEVAIESGNHLIIQDALQEAGAVTLFAYLQTEEGREAIGAAQNAENIERITEEINAKGGIGEMSTSEVEAALAEVASLDSPESLRAANTAALCVVLVFAVAVVAVLVLIAAVAVAVILVAWLGIALHTAIWKWTWVFSARAGVAMTELQLEQMVNSLAVTFGSTQPEFLPVSE